ncbi:MAG TPA: DNA adenine methylase [Blastocatellia bacterium]|nr:DNA adenine methylase [Blastocatellia bacterium]
MVEYWIDRVNYIGSKHSLLPFLDRVYSRVADGDERVFCDIFAGTAAVGRHFKRRGMKVIANDLQYYAYALNKAYIEINDTPPFTALRKKYRDRIARHSAGPGERAESVLAFINNLSGKRGFISANYGPDGNRLYYTQENAEKADAIRQSIERWREQKIITEREYFYVLCSLLEAIDQVANTASVYGAFLKKFKASARRPLALRPLELSNHVAGCRVFNRDANDLIEEIKCDVLYLDPPYNHRQYGANYHVLETVASYDSPELSGITGMRSYPRSLYCRRRSAREALEQLVRSARAKHILLSYNDEGLLSLDEVRRILSLRGTPRTFHTPYSRFKADNGRTYKRDATVEYVHYVRVEKSKK